ncbi:protein GAMETE CELL DEFECTIVE 1, mitochondrial isoform X2 [Magnolia sinica]|nr:protein GAMETE CELL DEFECTIVE 1, mitochondrial isoform X2 [Magnolia sinica]
MQSLKRLPASEILRLSISRSLLNLPSKSSKPSFFSFTSSYSSDSNFPKKDGEDEWNNAWESAWLPEDLAAAKNRAHWEIDVNFSKETVVLSPDVDPDTKAFVQDMDENWNQRRGAALKKLPMRGGEGRDIVERAAGGGEKESLESMKKDYRLKKQRIHAGLWMKEIEKEEEASLGNLSGGADIERLLDSCSEIFDTSSSELNDWKVPSSSEFKTKPDGWETTSKAQDGSVWEMSQREEDILLQEFERRIAFSKFQIASFIKSHIFSRRRPIDGWKYMIEELGPNAKRGKGSTLRLPSLSDASTQPFKEEKTSTGRRDISPHKRR